MRCIYIAFLYPNTRTDCYVNVKCFVCTNDWPKPFGFLIQQVLHAFHSLVDCRTVSLNSGEPQTQVPTIPADTEFYTLEISTCLRACFERQDCHVLVFNLDTKSCNLFLNVLLTNLTLQDDQWSRLYTIECIGNSNRALIF